VEKKIYEPKIINNYVSAALRPWICREFWELGQTGIERN
jgi:hypothetical protein